MDEIVLERKIKAMTDEEWSEFKKDHKRYNTQHNFYTYIDTENLNKKMFIELLDIRNKLFEVLTLIPIAIEQELHKMDFLDQITVMKGIISDVTDFLNQKNIGDKYLLSEKVEIRSKDLKFSTPDHGIQ